METDIFSGCARRAYESSTGWGAVCLLRLLLSVKGEGGGKGGGDDWMVRGEKKTENAKQKHL